MKKIISVLLLIMAVMVLAGCKSEEGTTTEVESPISSEPELVVSEEVTALAQCLTDKGAIMYGASWCSHCKEQKTLFGEAFSKINYVECTEQADKCNEAGIEGYPTWIINNEKLPGTRPLEQLAEKAGCSS